MSAGGTLVSVGAPLRPKHCRLGQPAPILLLLCSLGLSSCAPPEGGAATDTVPSVPEPDTTDMESQVASRLHQVRRAVLEAADSPEAWGRFGMVAHAHELWEEAAIAYRRAAALDPTDERWPYFLGDVLSVVGTELEAAATAFRRAIALRPGYAPAHMRLGRALLAGGHAEAAAKELERALELAPDLQPARVSLGQIRLSQGALDEAAELLEAVLAEEPRHAQALSSLGQLRMRQGRRGEARKIAERARSAAIYNLFDDPLMTAVVAEGISGVLLWERAKAFFDNGDYEQAALGLQRVVELMPENADVHQQLGVAYGNLGDGKRARYHLQRTVTLAPDRVEALIQLATAALDQGDPAAAIGHLERLLELAPQDPDGRWLLGRAWLMHGDPAAALRVFAAAAAAGGRVPTWARNEWGSALAQSGRPAAALEQFRAALADDPENAQALFYTGLLHEGLGRVDEAVRHYCRSIEARPNPPARGRLEALGRRCG